MREVVFRLDGDILTFDGARPRRLGDADAALFKGWIERYHKADANLLALGEEIGAWLDGPDHWIATLRDAPAAPVVAAFQVKAQPSDDDRRFLDVPWEIAARDRVYFAEQPALMWAPLRRIGDKLPPPAPDHDHKLGVMFVAAAPRGQTELDFEAEEAAILTETRDMPMDLYVEDEGSIRAIRTAWTNAGSLDVMHLSCHGLGGDAPFLALEDDDGELNRATLADLAGAFVPRTPRLLFLSACHTGDGRADLDPARTVDSLALGLVQAGFPSVLGWADAVHDTDASRFAAAFYERAAEPGAIILSAWAAARFALMREPRRPAHWHLARLFLGPTGGGVLAAGRTLRITSDRDAGRKGIVEARSQRIEVAGRFEFVGRRRELRAIRREFRVPEHAGVLIHGQGRQGKSSLAARVIDRNPGLKPVALFRACDGASVLAAIKDEVAAAEPAWKSYGERLAGSNGIEDAAALRLVLRELLTVPCGHGGTPILLVLDDFEALLDPPSGDGHWQVKPGPAPALAAIIRAFDGITTPSRLLITCRYDFPFVFEGRELGSRLKRVHLPPMSQADVLKQAARKRRAAEGGHLATDPAEFARHVGNAVRAARGNTGVRDMLFQAVLADAAAGERAIAQVDGYFARRDGPDEAEAIEDEAIRGTVEGLIVDTLIGLLTPPERALLETSSLFELPVPMTVWNRHAKRCRTGPTDRLVSFGLWDRFPDLVMPRQDAGALNPISGARIARPTADTAAVADILPDLFTAWGGPDRSKAPTATDIELTRLALECDNAEALEATAFFALQGLASAGAYRRAAETATRTLDCLDTAKRVAKPDLLRAAAEAFDFAGDPGGLSRVFANGPILAADDPVLPTAERIDRAHFGLRYAGWLTRQGDPDTALTQLFRVRDVLEALGDRRSRAVTLGDIARIMTSKGEVDAALALQAERLAVNEALGDQDGIAAASFDLGQIKLQRALDQRDGALFQEAYDSLARSHAIFKTIGHLDGICGVGTVLARVLAMAGQVAAARAMLEECRAGFQKLGQPAGIQRVEAILRALPE
jgi:hypothetical protein